MNSFLIGFVDDMKPENPEKENPSTKSNNWKQTHHAYEVGSRTWTWVTLVENSWDASSLTTANLRPYLKFVSIKERMSSPITETLRSDGENREKFGTKSFEDQALILINASAKNDVKQNNKWDWREEAQTARLLTLKITEYNIIVNKLEKAIRVSDITAVNLVLI